MSVAGKRSSPGDRVKQLRAFCHTARLGSFTRAAEHLESSQSSVSQQVRGLERELELMLFERNGSVTRLTPIGMELLQVALPVVMDMERLPEAFEERFRGTSSGRLAIGASTICAAKMAAGYLKRFREEHAGVRFELKVGAGAERVAWLRDREVELAFGAMDVVPPDLEFRHLLTSGMVLILPVGHPLSGNPEPSAEEIASFPVIAQPPGHYARRTLEETGRHFGVRFDIVMELPEWDLIKRHVEFGAGIAAVPEIVLDDSDRVERIPLHPRVPLRRYGVYRSREGILSRAAERFCALIESGSPPSVPASVPPLAPSFASSSLPSSASSSVR